jgi:hypothetical protein
VEVAAGEEEDVGGQAKRARTDNGDDVVCALEYAVP